MEIRTKQAENVTIVELEGRMDATTTSDFDAQAKALLAEGHTHVLLEMAGLIYVSSAGLRSLLSLAKALKGVKGKLGFCGLQPMVSEVFRISGFDKLLSIYEDQATALVALKA